MSPQSTARSSLSAIPAWRLSQESAQREFKSLEGWMFSAEAMDLPLDQLEREYASHPTGESLPVSSAERARIRALVQDLPLVWHAPTTTAAERKQLVRLLIKDVTLIKGQTTIQVAVRW